MAKKRSRTRGKPQQKYSLPQLRLQAGQALENRKFKEAVNLYKQLLKLPNTETALQQEWRELLAQAYAGRATQLAEKSMIQEALILWRQRATACDKPLITAEYMHWILCSGDHKSALELYLQHQESLNQSRQLKPFRGRLAALLLGCEADRAAALLSMLDDSDTLKSSYTAAFAALQGYCNGDQATMQGALEKISFRSPYRELRTILKGEPEKIGTDSPFHPLAQLLQLARCDRFEMVRALEGVDKNGLQQLSSLRGWSTQQQQLVARWQSLEESPKGETILHFLSTFQPLNPGYSKQSALALILYNHKLSTLYQRLFGHVTRQQVEWLAALEAELRHFHPAEIAQCWEDYLEQIPAGEAHDLERALVLSHLIELNEKLFHDLPDSRFSRKGKRHLIESLQQALEYDSNDLNGWIKLIRWQRELNQLKQARTSIESALQHFPQNIKILEEAAETASHSGAHKKAARYARQILETDPVNQRVKRLLFESHHTHAAKQLRQGMYPHCEQELEHAAAWASGPEQLGRLALARANLYSQLKKPCLQWLEQAQQQLGDGITLRFMMAQESHSDHPVTLPPLKAITSADDLLMLSRLAEEKIERWYRNKGERPALASRLEEVLLPHQKILQQAARLPQLTLEHAITLCALWLRNELEALELALPYAEAALQRWPGHRLLCCYRLIAQERREDGADLDEVDQLLEQAREAGDSRVTQLLLEQFPWLLNMDSPHDPVTPPWEEIDNEEEHEYADAFESTLPELISSQLDQAIEDLVAQIPLGQLISKATAAHTNTQEFKQQLADLHLDSRGNDAKLKLLLLALLKDEGKEILNRIMAGEPWRG